MAVENAEWERKAREWIENVGGFKLGSGSLQQELKNGIALCNFINVLQPGSVRKVSKLPGPFNQMENIKAFLDAVHNYGLAKEDTFVTVDLFEGRNMKQVQEMRECYQILIYSPFKLNRIRTPDPRCYILVCLANAWRISSRTGKLSGATGYKRFIISENPTVIRTIYAIGRKTKKQSQAKRREVQTMSEFTHTSSLYHLIGQNGFSQAQEKNAPYPPLGPKESKGNKREFTKEQMEAGKHVLAMRF